MDSDTVLIVVDVQNDFCAGGALAVPDGDAVVPVVNELIPKFESVVFTQDCIRQAIARLPQPMKANRRLRWCRSTTASRCFGQTTACKALKVPISILT